MQICPKCAREHDDGDTICVYCGHVRLPADKALEPPVVSTGSEPAAFATPPATPVPASFASPPAVPTPSRGTIRYGLVGGAALGIVAAAMFMMRSTGRDTAPVAAAAASAPRQVPESEPLGEPKWRRTRQSAWATDGSRTMGYELDAERTVAVYMDQVRPVLAVRCLSRSMEVFVLLQSSASIESAGTHSVRIGLDGEPDVDQQWQDSVDSHALFAPDGKALAARMAAAKRLRFSFKPFNAPRANVEFDVHGFDEPLAAMSKMCEPGPARRTVPRG